MSFLSGGATRIMPQTLCSTVRITRWRKVSATSKPKSPRVDPRLIQTMRRKRKTPKTSHPKRSSGERIMHPATFKAIKKAAKAAGAKDPEAVAGAAYWATVKAKHKKAKGEADEESLVPHEELKAPFEPGGNGDPSPNPSARQTIGSTKSVTIAGGANISQPEEYRTIDEGEPNPYEMLSTARKAPDLNAATEPDYFEYVPPSSGPDDRKQRWQDPAGDDDWLRSIGVIGAHPNMGGSKL